MAFSCDGNSIGQKSAQYGRRVGGLHRTMRGRLTMASKKDYIATAAIIDRQRKAAERYDQAGNGLIMVKRIAEDFADLYAGQSGQFDRGRFAAACGLTSI